MKQVTASPFQMHEDNEPQNEGNDTAKVHEASAHTRRIKRKHRDKFLQAEATGGK